MSAKKLPTLMLGALGVVFGDIGTSPLYAVQQVFSDTPGFAHDRGAILGILSLIIWSVILAVCVKYTMFVLRADHDGEGGTLAMLGLIEQHDPPKPFASPTALTLLVLFGSALLYGDGMITPSISVLSAVEGLNVATDIFKPYVLPIAASILFLLFIVQSRGTEAVGRLFGPVMFLWFGAIGLAGIVSIANNPAVLAALDPRHAVTFLFGHGWLGYATLAWYVFVLPGLLLNYLGQGALLLHDPAAAAKPFFAILPHWAIYPMVALSTAATVIASQALISGAFSLTRQAVNLGLAPRYAVHHTSADSSGQVYMPVVNYFLMIGCLAVVLSFRTSDALGNAYGLAVIGTMTITSIVFFVVTTRVWHWPLYLAVPLAAAFLVFDLAFLGANLAKILQGAWVPLAIAAFVFTVLTLWTVGRARYRRALATWSMKTTDFQADMQTWERREGSAIFLTSNLDHLPLVRRHKWLRENCRYDNVLLLKIDLTPQPYVSDENRVTIKKVCNGFHTGEAHFGFMEEPCVGAVLAKVIPFDLDAAAFILARPIPTNRGALSRRALQRIYIFLSKTGLTPIEWFQIPAHQAVSVGLELEM